LKKIKIIGKYICRKYNQKNVINIIGNMNVKNKNNLVKNIKKFKIIQKKVKICKKRNHRLTNGICSAPVRRFGFHKNPVGLSPFVGFCSPTFLQPCKTYGFAYTGCKNVIYLERYAKTQFKFIVKIKVINKSLLSKKRENMLLAFLT
jgi:hypothetical protein